MPKTVENNGIVDEKPQIHVSNNQLMNQSTDLDITCNSHQSHPKRISTTDSKANVMQEYFANLHVLKNSLSN